MWALRNAFWNAWNRFKYKSYKPVVVPTPVDGPAIDVVPVAAKYDGIEVTKVLVPASIPDDEAEAARSKLYRVQARLLRWFSPMRGQIEPIAADPQLALTKAFPAKHQKHFRSPVLPDVYRDGIDLGGVAFAGPYTGLLAADGDGLAWDLRHLDGFDHHGGLRSLGSHVRFAVDGAGLRATEIDCELGVVHPDDPSWQDASQLVLCAASTALSLEQHFTWLHYLANTQVAVATRNALPAAHPLRRLLWPHVFRSHFTADIITEGQLEPGADLECMYSFTSKGVWQVVDHSAERFDLLWIDPERDAVRRGLTSAGIDLPPLTNRLDHFAVMLAHAQRYLALYYPTDGDLANDDAVGAWVAHLQQRLPGVGAFFAATPTVGELARLVGSFIHLATVEHEIVGAGGWDYQLWPQAQPCRVYANGQRMPIDVYQRLVNFNFLLNVPRTPLLQDFSFLGVDEPGKEEFRRFLRELEDLQTRLERERGGPWRFTPAQLLAHINV